ncbi:MAG: threonylcarbamoyl-AMP synthase [Candidatus Aenigmarchaeota archaeon]|nr:threonylcarbamoyl-AMP synthase [Candidatus Aenigmarchaeota archaeon]NIP40773.1 threonylcarbamoyl-AMP synthase [Candidatus Aenigmarchaeota archaeon]NIQ17363.1 threonylcarbamoyl-AMP synthase [Candidatus Aenigmarchaeota archaeon]NIS73476.1 threonylcarbamoyl-AMP synthase [Candidatus Aenigmarchaeota archaeon]
MKTVKLSKALKSREVKQAISEGRIFIYPTDTLYGIGCNPDNRKSVEKIMKAKGREKDKPFSVIVPSKEWISENTRITKENRNFVDVLLPGPYTVILKAKERIPYVVSKEGSVGIRIPKNEFCDLIRSLGIIFVTTSVNLSEEEPVYSIKDVPKEIKEIADYAIDSGRIEGRSSRVFDIRTNELKIARW